MGLGDEWRLICEETWGGAMNMALDSVAAETASETDLRTARVFRWEPSTLSMGYGQAVETVDWAYCEREGIDVVRRPTGGGGIFHDSWGDISYSIIAPADELPGDLLESYHLLLDPILDAFERMGVDARIAEAEQRALYEPSCYLRDVHPAHDVVVDGRKISGNAQHRTRDAVVQHGSLTYEHATNQHLSVFDDSPVTPEAFERRVTSIHEQADIDRGDALAAIETALAEWAGATDESWTDEELAQARNRADERFSGTDWTHRR